MKKFLYGLTTVVLGIFIHLLFSRYFSHHGIGPHLLLLFVVSQGFLLGPVMGETIGFVWGLVFDSMGVSFFGLHGFLFALAGYLSGVLRRRVASERPSTQLAIGLIGTLYYFFGTALVRYILEGDALSLSWVLIFIGIFYNVLLVTGVFWLSEWWVERWKINQEHL